MSFKVPILFLVFNRPQTTIKVFEKIREIKPSFLYVAADGPRKDKPREKEICEQVRNIVLSNVDWECDVKTLLGKKTWVVVKPYQAPLTGFLKMWRKE